MGVILRDFIWPVPTCSLLRFSSAFFSAFFAAFSALYLALKRFLHFPIHPPSDRGDLASPAKTR